MGHAADLRRPRLHHRALGDAIHEVDTGAWKVARRLETPAPGPYNAAVAPDERLLVVTYKKGDSVGFWT